MREKIADVRKKSGLFDNVSFAAGSCLLRPGMDLKKALSEADARMYQDKENWYRLNPKLKRNP